MNPENLEKLKLLKEAIEAIDFLMEHSPEKLGALEKWAALKVDLYTNAETIRDYSLEDYKFWRLVNARPKLSEQGSQEDVES